MTYKPPEHLAIYSHSNLIEDSEVAFHAEAIKIQLRDHVCPAWNIPVMNCAYYGHARNVPTDKNAILSYVNNDGNAESAGYHVDAFGFVYALIDVEQSRNPSKTGSHEGIEIAVNAYLNRTIKGRDGKTYWLEIADPVQAQGYWIDVELLNIRRRVLVSDFVLPAWYGMDNGPNVKPDQVTWMNQFLDPFEVAEGGYQIAQKENGETVFLNRGEFSMVASRFSRTHRIKTLPTPF